ncbi:hypothetical protein FNV43_RR08888 [Rhamnella rubrinervis]|uniref:23 kDa jasmonate-induced protein-like n=1 Tax=Rhamnella rubrinervis TaxID=2594499 RepID=A0A8K0MJG9_9ROSA|nr:hypothetical protein FNV43_RR08888 [Rhamnella rubrinervis]
MGDGVFGIPVTNTTLESLPEYEGNTKLKPIDRARVALNLKNSDGKNESALKYLLDLKETCGVDVGTLCLVYNATGDTLKYSQKKDWAGHIGSSPYPIQIANGQWGAFLHVIGKASSQSIGAVAYHGKDADAADCDWMVAWNNAWVADRDFSTTVYNEVRKKDHYNFVGPENFILQQMQKADVYYSDDANADQWKGTSSSASIGNHNFPIFTAILTLKDV